MPIDFTGGLRSSPFASSGFVIRALDPDADALVLHHWFTMDRARFWGMQHETEPAVRAIYARMVTCGHAMAYIGESGGRPAFLLECYDPSRDPIGQHYPVLDGDVGMHFMVGPAAAPVPGYTRRVFRTLMRFIFERLQARRVVVEPDVRNDKVHVLNREVGFVYHGCMPLQGKLAALAFCTREGFERSHHEEFAQ